MARGSGAPTVAPGDVTDVHEDALPALDVRGDEFGRDPHAVLRRTREHGPLARSHRGIEVLSYDLCHAILSNDEFATLGLEHFRDKGAPESLVSFVEHGVLLNVDRERHDRVRRVMSRAFSTRQVDAQRRAMRDVAERLVAPLRAAGRCDLVADFTEHYPMEVLCRFLGVPPEDIPTFHRAAIDLHLMAAVPLAPGFARLDEALRILWRFVHDLVEERAERPRDDFVSALVAARAEDGTLTDEEVVWNVVNLLFAGQDTTRYQLASAVREIAGVPGLWDALAGDPALIPTALEEAMRLRPVSQFVVRMARVPAEAGGMRFPPNRRVILNLLAASRDPHVFAAPETFDAQRELVSRIPFGWGLHYCLGHALARTEMVEGLAVLTESIACPRFGPAVEAGAAGMLGGPESLPMSFAARASGVGS